MAPLTLVNVVDDRAGREVSRVASSLTDVSAWVWALGGRSSNTVLAAGTVPLDRTRVAAALARDASPAAVEVLRN